MNANQLTYGLAAIMSDISEDCWCAGWMMGTEDTLPALCWLAARTDKPQQWGQGLVTIEDAKRLIELAELAGSWADMDGAPHQPDWKSAIEWLGELAQPIREED